MQTAPFDIAAFWLAHTQVALAVMAVMAALLPLTSPMFSPRYRFGIHLFIGINLVALPLGIAVAWMQHALLLFCFHGFMLYLLLSGWRAMNAATPGLIDRCIPGLLAAVGAAVLLETLSGPVNARGFLLLLFALQAFALAAYDWRLLARPVAPWLTRHVGGMLGALAANISVLAVAFMPQTWQFVWPALLIVAAGVMAWRRMQARSRTGVLYASPRVMGAARFPGK
ncbi:MAG: hypothetical protein GC131_08865 [Alphaproteobacteria bacterium]|nr:hypothetical protein [Alphaproteobacteria bacterium]